MRSDGIVFSFSHVCPNWYQLHDWDHDELKALVENFKIMEQLGWNGVPKAKGLRFKPTKTRQENFPDSVPEDATIHEVSVTMKARVFGFRDTDTFFLVWFDWNHKVFPE